MSPENKRDPEVNLNPHPLVPEHFTTDAADGLTVLMGFIGPSTSDGRVRVYLDLSFESYFAVARNDVVQTAAVDSDDENSPSILWVRSSAKLMLVNVGRLTGDAKNLTGAIRRYHRARQPRDDTDFCSVFCDGATEGCGSSWACGPSDACTADIFCTPK
ncbi:hypothetical protein [Streptomyces sp. SAI-229]|jgi:hypothetical protein|uniref:hypothetical protein n=1 Tax=Streptomyces sp. SAI-229 TaxID=3377731 RepID=UPI003C7B7712